MSTAQVYTNLVNTVGQIKAVEKERLLRGTLGEESLQQSGFAETLETILRKANFATEYAEVVDNGSVENVTSILNNIRQTLEDQGKRNNTDYVAQRQNFLTQIPTSLEQLRLYWP